MKEFLWGNRTSIALSMAWLFSLACSTQPPLDPKAGYYKTWAHDLIQAVAANMHKINKQPPV